MMAGFDKLRDLSLPAGIQEPTREEISSACTDREREQADFATTRNRLIRMWMGKPSGIDVIDYAAKTGRSQLVAAAEGMENLRGEMITMGVLRDLHRLTGRGPRRIQSDP
jgi:hypothetical protein